jgi:hypothetical protein
MNNLLKLRKFKFYSKNFKVINFKKYEKEKKKEIEEKLKNFRLKDDIEKVSEEDILKFQNELKEEMMEEDDEEDDEEIEENYNQEFAKIKLRESEILELQEIYKLHMKVLNMAENGKVNLMNE